MRFALVDGERREADPDLRGRCVGCGSDVIPRCGEVRIHHWAHKGRHRCDPWWENETEWHRGWKARFPDEWQEVVHHAADGERHIADVKTENGWVLEFQHSYIKPEERRSREAFYPKLMWVVDGTRRKRDEARFLRAFQESSPLTRGSPIRRVWSGEGALFRDWVGSLVSVFFDFGDPRGVWWLLPFSDDSWAYVMPHELREFIRSHSRTDTDGAREFDRVAREIAEALAALRNRPNPRLVRKRPLRRGRRL